MTALPPGWTLRPPTLDDEADLLALVSGKAVADDVPPDDLPLPPEPDDDLPPPPDDELG